LNTSSSISSEDNKGITLRSLIRAVELGWKGSTSQQLEFLISGYTHDQDQSSSLSLSSSLHKEEVLFIIFLFLSSLNTNNIRE
jgi:hypothetical protein